MFTLSVKVSRGGRPLAGARLREDLLPGSAVVICYYSRPILALSILVS